MNGRTVDAEFFHAVSAWTFEGDAIALATDTTLCQTVHRREVNHNHAVVIIWRVPERFATTQIAITFFAQSANEDDIAFGFNLLIV